MRYREVEQIGGRIQNMRRKGRRGVVRRGRSMYGMGGVRGRGGERGGRLFICIVTHSGK